ncbi:sodium:proton antiporter [Mycobacterium sp. IS-1590]|uniref:Na+/H+ antiporter subunit E n=1 Tax=Mycobacterium sp. IS-1590 TaxID=1772286 RepID=UPI0007484696|nr:Na+/H+ antiporter subunit E [Mycobacterium sp. IS-1590]KUI45293.1 sodium:proton antiporter [Mycobacterium sp. IS-1590]
MIAAISRVVALTAVYLMVLSSVEPADILIGALLATLIVLAGTVMRKRTRHPDRPAGTTPWRRMAGVPALIGVTVLDMCRASWTVSRHCLGLQPMSPGLVTMAIRPGSPASATAWAIRVGLSPDTVVVDVDDEEGTLVLHVLDARDPDAIRREQMRSYEHAQRRVFP